MKPAKLIVSMILTSALLPIGRIETTAAAPGKSQHGGKAADHMSERGSANGNAQWSADPEKGWVRAESPHEWHEQSHKSTETHQQSNKGKSKPKKD